MGVSRVPVRDIALALFITISMPPNCFTASSTAFNTLFSSLTSTTHGRAFPPALSTIKNYTLVTKLFYDN